MKKYEDHWWSLGYDLVKSEYMQNEMEFDITTNKPKTKDTKPEDIIRKKIVFFDGKRFYISKEGWSDARLNKMKRLGERAVVIIPAPNLSNFKL